LEQLAECTWEKRVGHIYPANKKDYKYALKYQSIHQRIE